MQQRSMRTFIIIWIGQLISLVGSGMTGFAMGVWLVEETGRATPFGITLAVGTLPRILLAPIAGTYVDRWNRRLIMLVADTLAAVTTGIALVLLLSGELAIWHVYLLAGFGALTGAFQQPASQAIVPLIVPKEKLGQANGMVQAAEAMQFLLSPLLAGLLFVAVGLRGVIAIDLITFVAAVATLLVVHIPDPERSAEAESASGSVWQEAAYGFRFLLERRGLLIMVGYFALVNLFANMAASLLPPMILANAEADVLGIVQMVSGLGMVVGSVVT
ncbi:MAG: MFS transporter, partial [Chloroflexi bacterium]|nr:MFS transporter [Chloroflexota bacterium]